MLLIYEIIKKFIQRTSAPMCDMLKKFAEKKMYNISHHIF